MVNQNAEDTDQLLLSFQQGNDRARDQLLQRHQERLRQVIAMRLSSRLAQRVGVSDILQESLMKANQRLPEYVQNQPLPFYLWLRRIALDQLCDAHRRNVLASKRSLHREQPLVLPLSEDSVHNLADYLASQLSSPVEHMKKKELQKMVREWLDLLSPSDREILVMRHLEQLSVSDIAAALEIREETAKRRLLRALTRLRDLLRDQGKTSHDN